MGELVAVTCVDKRPIGGGAVGPMTRRLMELYRKETMGSGDPILDGDVGWRG